MPFGAVSVVVGKDCITVERGVGIKTIKTVVAVVGTGRTGRNICEQ